MTSATTPLISNLNGSHRAEKTLERYRVSVDEYVRFKQQGFLVVPQLVSPQDIEELRQHTEDLMQGRLPEQQTEMNVRNVAADGGTTKQLLEAPPAHLSPDEKAQFFLRIHMLHRKLELHERYLLHPRVLDVLESLIGPDILALQTMLFLKPPGKPGQGWHQDTYYIPTHPDSLIGAGSRLTIATNSTAPCGSRKAARMSRCIRRAKVTATAKATCTTSAR
jgi:ectoine hydroxylase-related dioxygenase (phytanoyl-CoA dioxygenase family)